MLTTSAVSHWVSVRARPGRSAQLGARLSSLISPSAAASGCLHFGLQKSLTDENLWVITGSWADSSAMNDWFAAPELNLFSELVAELLVASLDFQTFATVTPAQAQTPPVAVEARLAG
ncbi:quinol monooxygenase YgiN [Pseudomonas graminis]|uniref:antibiotic biosynthesis monooxygenase family protein n=1 Tax=Pseudomonas graminis TaxID=158627 RepID=UPI00105DE8C2|nr:antibiotic biosynthesis monooxygenase family protein [Pseudomonas graminis]TDV55807.1 quinol monooxygenase YgiN [Pseudomonas graminis]